LCVPESRSLSPDDRNQTLTPSVVFVTPSYRLDRDRCALLNRSLEACAPSFEHLIVVDRGDLPAFRPLQNHRTTVLAKEEILPVWVHRLDTLRIGLRSNVWVQAGGRPIRGWLLQQLVKLAIVERLTADVVVHADSDVVLLRPFTSDSVVDAEGRVRLYAAPDQIDERLPYHVRWHRSAEALLGVERAHLPAPDFISSLVPWRRENAVALLDHVEQTTGRHWLRALAAARDVSEYTLYGRFAQDVMGANGMQYVAPSPLCADYYKRSALSVHELIGFLDQVGDEAIAVSLTAKAGMKPEHYAQVLESRWGGHAPSETTGVHTRPRVKTTVPSSPTGRDRGRATRRPSRGTARRPTVGTTPLDARRSVGVWMSRLQMATAMGLLVLLMLVLLGFGID
jgi:hypothetical protein